MKRKKLLARLIVSALMLNFVGAEAAEPEYQMDSLIVTATKIEQEVDRLPVSATVITAGDIEKLNIKTIDQALTYASGVYISRGKGLTDMMSDVTLRGFADQKRTLVLLDGQPLNQAYSGSVQWSAIPVENVEKIEVVKGPASALYGGNAVGGVINVITKKQDKQQINFSAGTGSYNTRDLHLGMGDKTGKFSYYLGFDKIESDGYNSSPVVLSPNGKSKPSGVPEIVSGWRLTTDKTGTKTQYIVGDKGRNTWEQSTFSSKLSYDLTADRTVTFSYSRDSERYDYEDYNTYLKDSAGNPEIDGYIDLGPANPANKRYWRINPNSFLDNGGKKVINLYSLAYQDKLSGFNFRGGLQDIATNWYVDVLATAPAGLGTATPAGGAGKITSTPSKNYDFDLNKVWKNGSNGSLIAGINYRREKAYSTERYLSDWRDESSVVSLPSTPYGTLTEAGGKTETKAIYVEYQRQLTDRLSATVGGRYDYWTNYDGVSRASSTAQLTAYPERSDRAFSPRTGFSYRLGSDQTIYLGWGKAFRPPNIYDLYRTWTSSSGKTYMANPELKPETVSTIELGWKKRTGRSLVGLTVFRNDIDDLVYSKSIDSNTTRKENAGKGVTEGVELDISHQFDNNWSIFMNYTYQDPIIEKNTANPASEGKQVPNVPSTIFNTGVVYNKDKWRTILSGSYVSKRHSSDTNDDVVNGVYTSYDPYFIANLNIEWQKSQNTSVTFGVANLFDRQYYSYYLAPGRTYDLKVTCRF